MVYEEKFHDFTVKGAEHGERFRQNFGETLRASGDAPKRVREIIEKLGRGRDNRTERETQENDGQSENQGQVNLFRSLFGRIQFRKSIDTLGTTKRTNSGGVLTLIKFASLK